MVVAAFGILSRVLGLVRETVLGRVYGTGAAADAFQNGLFIVNTIAAVLLYTLVTLLIPVFQNEEREHGEASAWRLLGAIMAWVGMALVVLTGIVAIWPEGVTAIFRTDDARAALTAELIRIMAPAVMLQGLSAVLTAVLQVRGRFTGPAAVGVAFNLGILVAIASLTQAIGIRAAAWGVMTGAVLQVLLQLPEFRRFWRANDARLGIRHPRLRAAAVTSIPVVGASLVQQFNSFTDKFFANGLSAGRVSALSYANTLGAAPRTALLFPLLTPLFPHIARLMSERRHQETTAALVRASGLLALVSIPVSLYLAVEAYGITDVVFSSGSSKCDITCRDNIAAPLVFYGLAVWGAFLVYLMNRALSAARRPREIMIATVVTVIVITVLDVILIGPLEHTGLALASMVGVYVNTALMVWYLRRHLPGFSPVALVRQQLRILLCAVPAAVLLVALDIAAPSVGRGFVATLALTAGKGLAALALFVAVVRAGAPKEFANARATLRSIISRRGPEGPG